MSIPSRPRLEIDMSERFITGPEVPQIVNLSTSLKYSKDVLSSEARYYDSEWHCAITDARVVKGCFVFEAKCNGPVRIGWATNQFNKSDKAGQNADSWVLRIKERTLHHKNADDKGTACEGTGVLDGTVISCVLDVDNASITYYSNGAMVGNGPAFTSVRGTSSTTFTPIIALQSDKANVSITFSSTLKYNIAGAIPLAHATTAEQKKQIKALWTKYHNASINLSESGDRGTIKSQGIFDLAKDILDDEEKMSLVLAVVAWKFRASTGVWEISESEFVGGLEVYGIFDMTTFANKMTVWLKELDIAHVFKGFYAFIFSYMLPAQRVVLDVPEAVETWNVLGFPSKFPELWAKWQAYIETKKTISKDAWVLLPEFLTTIQADFSGFDENACWPAILEDFVLDNKA